MNGEILRAIKWLEPSKGNYDDWLYSHVWMSRGEFYGIIQTSLVALQEQLNRLEGCDKCKEPKCLSCKYHYTGCSYSDVENICFDSIDSVKPNYKRYECKYKYCPNCGRKLNAN